MARASFGMANAMNKVAPARWAMEKVLGVDRHAALPDFATTAFDTWAERAGWVKPGPGGEAVLFQTCFVQNNDTSLWRDTLEVLRHNGVDVRVVKGLRCCGMPAWEHGDIDQLRRQAHDDLDLLLPHVEKGAKVLVVNPTCSMMMRREWPHLLEGPDRARAERLGPDRLQRLVEERFALSIHHRRVADRKVDAGHVAIPALLALSAAFAVAFVFTRRLSAPRSGCAVAPPFQCGASIDSNTWRSFCPQVLRIMWKYGLCSSMQT